MRTIHKFTLEIVDTQTVCMHLPVQLLTVQVQRGKPCLWALVDTDAPSVDVVIAMYGTGFDMPDWLPGLGPKYLASFQMHDKLVCHVFATVPGQPST